MLLWTSYPISVAIKNVYDHYKKDTNLPAVPTKCYDLELISSMERAASFGQTGNARVVIKKVMDPLYLSLSIMQGRMPSFSGIVSLKRAHGTFAVDASKWPTDKHGTPLLASSAAIKFHYNADMCDVGHHINRLRLCSSLSDNLQNYAAIFAIYHITVCPPKFQVFSRINSDSDVYRPLCILYTVLRLFVIEMRALVANEILPRIRGMVNLEKRHKYEARLKDWSTLNEPFSTEGEAMQKLIKLLGKDDLPLHPTTQGISKEELASTIMSIMESDSVIHTPFTASFQSVHLLRVAYQTILPCLLAGERPAPAKLKSCLCTVISTLKIHILPWATTPRSRTPSSTSWVTIGARDNASSVNEAQFTDSAKAAAQRLQEERTDRPWSVADYSLDRILDMKEHTIAPNELDASNGKGKTGGIVEEHYTWVQTNFSMKNKVHRLLLYVAAVVAKTLPYVFIDCQKRVPNNRWSICHPRYTKEADPCVEQKSKGCEGQGSIYLPVRCACIRAS